MEIVNWSNLTKLDGVAKAAVSGSGRDGGDV